VCSSDLENWGCGGSMRPEYYADEYRRYATYCRHYGENRLYKIACGPNGSDFHWTEVLMKNAGAQMDGLALHYYCGSGKKSRAATQFDAEDWFHLLKNAHRLEELVARHSTIMDQYDPQKRVGLIVDEWGAWHAVEPGTNPGFLYQQNTLRDALVAGLSLNIFNNHSDRVRMANIAQTVNVLQAVILTEGAKMLLTPTYHVFDMYQVHQDATLLPSALESDKYAWEKDELAQLSVSASRDAKGAVHVTLCNLHHAKPAQAVCEVRGVAVKKVEGQILTAAQMTAHNTFERPAALKPVPFKGAKLARGSLALRLPPRSVVLLRLR
jgi:alpha-N-arabinofuranosidase